MTKAKQQDVEKKDVPSAEPAQKPAVEEQQVEPKAEGAAAVNPMALAQQLLATSKSGVESPDRQNAATSAKKGRAVAESITFRGIKRRDY